MPGMRTVRCTDDRQRASAVDSVSGGTPRACHEREECGFAAQHPIGARDELRMLRSAVSSRQDAAYGRRQQDIPRSEALDDQSLINHCPYSSREVYTAADARHVQRGGYESGQGRGTLTAPFFA